MFDDLYLSKTNQRFILKNDGHFNRLNGVGKIIYTHSLNMWGGGELNKIKINNARSFCIK